MNNTKIILEQSNPGDKEAARAKAKIRRDAKKLKDQAPKPLKQLPSGRNIRTASVVFEGSGSDASIAGTVGKVTAAANRREEEEKRKAAEDMLKIPKDEDTVEFFLLFLDAHYTLVHEKPQTEDTAEARSSAYSTLLTQLDAEQKERFESGGFSSPAVYDSTNPKGLSDDDWQESKLRDKLVKDFINDVLNEPAEPTAVPDVKTAQPDVGPTVARASKLEAEANAQILDKEHMERLQNHIKKRGHIMTNCLDDLEENKWSYFFLSLAWAAFISTIHDVLSELPRFIKNYSERVKTIAEYQAQRFRELDPDIEPGEYLKKTKDKITLELDGIAKEVEVFETARVKLEFARGELLRAVKNADPKTQAGILLKGMCESAIALVQELITSAAKLTGIYGTYSKSMRMGARLAPVLFKDTAAELLAKDADGDGLDKTKKGIKINPETGKPYNVYHDALDLAVNAKKLAVTTGVVAGIFGLGALRKRTDAYRDLQAAGEDVQKANEFNRKLRAIEGELKTIQSADARQKFIDDAFSDKGVEINGKKISLGPKNPYKITAEEYETLGMIGQGLEIGSSTAGLYLQQMLASLAIIDLAPEYLLPNYYLFDFKRECSNTVALPLGLIASFGLSSAYKVHKTNRIKKDVFGKSISQYARTELVPIRQQYAGEVADDINRVFKQANLGRSEAAQISILKIIHKIEEIIFMSDNVLNAKTIDDALQEIELIIAQMTEPKLRDLFGEDIFQQIHKKIGSGSTVDEGDTVNYLRRLLLNNAKRTYKTIDDGVDEKYKSALQSAHTDAAARRKNRAASQTQREELEDLIIKSQETTKQATISRRSAEEPSTANFNDVEITLEDAAPAPKGVDLFDDAIPDETLTNARNLDDIFDDLDTTKPLPGETVPDSNALIPPPDDTVSLGGKLPVEEHNLNFGSLSDDFSKKLDEADQTIIDRFTEDIANKTNVKIYHDLVRGNSDLLGQIEDGIRISLGEATDRFEETIRNAAARNQAVDQVEMVALLREAATDVGMDGVQSIFRSSTKIEIADDILATNFFRPMIRKSIPGQRAGIDKLVREFIEDFIDNTDVTFSHLNPDMQAQLQQISRAIKELAFEESQKLLSIPRGRSLTQADTWVKWVDNLPITISKVILACYVIEKLLEGFMYYVVAPLSDGTEWFAKLVGKDLDYDTCMSLRNKLQNFKLGSGVTSKQILKLVECTVEEKAVFDSVVAQNFMETSQSLTSFLAKMIAVRFAKSDEKREQIVAEADFKSNAEEHQKSVEERSQMFWKQSLMHLFLDGSTTVVDNKIDISTQYLNMKILAKNLVFTQKVANDLIEVLKKRIIKSDTAPGAGYVGNYIFKPSDQTRAKRFVRTSMTGVLSEQMGETDENILQNFILAMGPHDQNSGGQPVPREKLNFKFAKSLPPEEKKIFTNQVKLIILTLLESSDFEDKIVNQLKDKSRKARPEKTDQDKAAGIIKDAVESTFKEISDFNNGYEPTKDAAGNDINYEDISFKLIGKDEKLFDKRADDFEPYGMYEDLFSTFNRIDKNLRDKNIENVSREIDESKLIYAPKSRSKNNLIEGNRSYISDLVRNMLLEFSYGQGYSPYPYHSDIGEEGEEAPDFIQDWKDFELSLVRDESRKTAIEIAKILVKDLELFGDVVDLVGKNQSVATEILKNFKKKK